METMYYKLVVAGKRTCDKGNTAVKQVPENLREAVMALLVADGRDANGVKAEAQAY